MEYFIKHIDLFGLKFMALFQKIYVFFILVITENVLIQNIYFLELSMIIIKI